jgi:uracil-DNA glycosylase
MKKRSAMPARATSAPTSAKAPTAAVFLPSRPTLSALRDAAAGCRGCELYARATQTVFGEGPARARLVLVGEQPGDQEDLEGRPFVGPAGAVLDRALSEAGLDRRSVYVTNAVKHFNFEPRGKARLHKKPKPGDVRACRPWLDAELAFIKPEVLVLLGSTASQAIFGPSFRLTRERGQLLTSNSAPRVVVTWHPSSILRAPDSAARARQFAELVNDLSVAAHALSRETASLPRN